MMSESSINMEDASIHAPRIGFCAPNISTKNTTLDAAEKGCWGGHGIGKGVAHTNCSGSGGAHGGAGGYGISIHGKACHWHVPQPYSWNESAQYEGSAGGAALPYLSSLGGNGGGIIWLIASQMIELQDSLVDVRGGAGKTYKGHQIGSGGGAGGSLHIMSRAIAGNAVLDASGGDGSAFGGGGGSGGRLVAMLLTSFNSTSHEHQSINWNGTIKLEGGKGGRRDVHIPDALPEAIKEKNKTALA